MSWWLWQWRRPQLPGWPRLPTQLGFWLLLILSALSLIFNKELWPHTWWAFVCSGAGILLSGLAMAVQVAQMLRHWVADYQGPFWMRLALDVAVGGYLAGLSLPALFLSLGMLVVLIILL